VCRSLHKNDWHGVGFAFDEAWYEHIVDNPSEPSEDSEDDASQREVVCREVIESIANRCFLKTYVNLSREDGGVKIVAESTEFEPYGGIERTNH
jgi:hypothetical protein